MVQLVEVYITTMINRITLTCLYCLLCFASVNISATDDKLHNRLKQHPSPYLAMHGDDPVAWQPWTKDVLERARRENKMLFVSIGYFACHWCHVMQRESYRDVAIAKLLNENFIPVKIDRELNPALDAFLIEFVQRTRGHAGWPLNVFVTPEGDPVVGMVYEPKDRFEKLLLQLKTMWAKDDGYLRKMAAQAAALQKGERINAGVLAPGIGKQFQAGFLQQAMQIADEMTGGFGEQNKFPMTDQLRNLVLLYKGNKQEQLGEFLQLTLDQMVVQGLRDQIGGGFYRYTIDPGWQTPHYEKMLYDNAGLAVLYLEAADVFQREDYRDIGRETLNFMIRELQTKEGGMVASLSAVNSAGVEGGYYLWQKESLLGLLSKPEYEVIYELWNLKAAATAAAGFLPRQSVSPDTVAQKLGLQTAEVMKTLSQAQLKLFRARQGRDLPIDTKQLASWNGLALYALAQGAKLERSDKYTKAAQRLRGYLVNRLWDGRQLLRARSSSGSLGQAGLEDYAYAAMGLYAWAEVSGYRKDIELAKQWVDIAWQRFYTATGWALTDKMLIQSDLGEPVLADSPMPSPSSTLLRVSLQLAEASGDDVLRNRVAAALSLGHSLLEQQPFYYANQIAVLHEFQAGRKK